MMKRRQKESGVGEKTFSYKKKDKRAVGVSVVLGTMLAFVVLAILVTVIVLLLPTNYLLARVHPDLSFNTGFSEPEALEKETWTTLEQTGYQDGEETSRTMFQRRVYGEYTITHVPAGETGEETVVYSTISGKWSSPLDDAGGYNSLEYVEGYDLSLQDYREREQYTYIEGSFRTGDRDELVSMDFHARGVLEDPDGVRDNWLYMDYDEAGRLTRQTRRDENEKDLGYRTYSYDEQDRLIRSEVFDADGSLRYTCETQYDPFGRMTRQEYRDVSGDLISREVYHFRVWELFSNLAGICTLIVILSIAFCVGVVGARVYRNWRKRRKGLQ